MTVRNFVNQVIAQGQLEDQFLQQESAKTNGARGLDMRENVKRKWGEFRQKMAEHQAKMQQMRADFERQKSEMETQQRQMQQEMQAAKQEMAAGGGGPDIAALEQDMAEQQARMEAQMREQQQAMQDQAAAMQAEMSLQMQEAQAMHAAAQAKMAAAQTEMERQTATMELQAAAENQKLVAQMVEAIQAQEAAKAAAEQKLGGGDQIEQQAQIAEEQLRMQQQELLPVAEAMRAEPTDPVANIDTLAAAAAAAIGHADRRNTLEEVRPFSIRADIELSEMRSAVTNMATVRMTPELEDRLLDGDVEVVAPALIAAEAQAIAAVKLEEIANRAEWSGALSDAEGVKGFVAQAASELGETLGTRGVMEPLANEWIETKLGQADFAAGALESKQGLLTSLSEAAGSAVQARLADRLQREPVQELALEQGLEGVPKFIGNEAAEWMAEAAHSANLVGEHDIGAGTATIDTLTATPDALTQTPDAAPPTPEQFVMALQQAGMDPSTMPDDQLVALMEEAGIDPASMMVDAPQAPAGPALPRVTDPTWSESVVNLIESRSVEGEAIPQERMNEIWDAAREQLGVEGPDDTGEPQFIEPDAFAALIAGAGLSTEGLSAEDIEQARAYVLNADTAGEQAGKLRKAIYNLEIKSEGLTPEITEEELAFGDAGLRAEPGPPITMEELESIGTGFAEGEMPAQWFWITGVVGNTNDMKPGVLEHADMHQINMLAQNMLGMTGGADPAGPPVEMTADVLAQMARDLGIPLERLDPSQLMQAVGYINNASAGVANDEPDPNAGPPADLQTVKTRTEDALRQLLYLDRAGVPEPDKTTMMAIAGRAAGLPWEAIDKAKSGEVGGQIQELAAALSNPGDHALEVGKFNVEVSVNENLQVTDHEAKKPGLFSKIGGFIKKALPIVSTVLMFVPGIGTAIGTAIKLASIAMSAVDAVKQAANGNWLGALTSAAGAVAGGIASGAQGLAAQVRTIASVTSRVGRGIQSIQQGGLGGLVSGLASVSGGLAEGLGNSLGGVGDALQTFSRYAQPAGSGFSAAQAAAQGNFSAAFSGAVGTVAAVNSLGDGSALGIGERGLDLMQAATRGVGMVDAIARGDYQTAMANALAAAGDLRAAADGRPEGDDTRTDYLRRAGEMALAADNLSEAIDSGNTAAIAGALDQLSTLGESLHAREASAEDAQEVMDAIQARQGNAVPTSERLTALLGDEASAGAANALGADRALAAIEEASTQLAAAIERGDVAAATRWEAELAVANLDATALGDLIWQVTPGNVPIETLPVELQLAQLRIEAPTLAPLEAGFTPNIPEGAVLGVGSSGEDVRQLQRALNEALGLNLDEDGVFGSQTGAALEEFQLRAGVTPDGLYGPETGGYLGVDVIPRASETVDVVAPIDSPSSASSPTAPGRDLDIDSALGLAMGVRHEFNSDNTVSGFLDLWAENIYNDWLADNPVPPEMLGTEGVRRRAGAAGSLISVAPDTAGYEARRQEAFEAAQRLANMATERQWGNCQELAAVVATRLHSMGVGGVEIMGREGHPDSSATHAFVVVGRLPDSDPNDPRTWGPDAMVVDGWAGNGRAYPADRLITTLDSKWPLPGFGPLSSRFALPDPGNE